MSEQYILVENPAFTVDISQSIQVAKGTRDVGEAVSSGTDDVIQTWRKVTTSFNEPGSNHIVDTAMSSLNDPSESIQQALSAGAKALETFLGEVKTLQTRHSALEKTRESTAQAISTAVKADDLAEAQRLSTAFNEQVRGLQSKFSTACSEAVLDVGRARKMVRLGTLPDGPGVPREVRYPAGSWTQFTASLDDAFKKDISLDQVAGRLKNMDPKQLQEWMDGNPEMAGKLTGRVVDTSTFKPGSTEAKIVLLAKTLATNPRLVDQISTLWNQLSRERQVFLLVAFPAFFGNLDGVPFKDRIKTNKLTLVGEKYRVEQRLKDLKAKEPPRPADQNNGYFGRVNDKAYVAPEYDWDKEHNQWKSEMDDAEKSHKGLETALRNGYQLVAVSGEGDGRYAVLRGNIDAATRGVAISVPGTTTDGGALETSVKRLDAMIYRTGAAGIYWQNTDLPDGGENGENPEWMKLSATAVDNMTSAYNKKGAPALAAFDFALDQELEARENTDKGSTGTVRTTYIAHSAGASMLGTAEAYGLDSTAEIYVAPAGEGTPSLIRDAGGRGNQTAQRYILQAPEGPIKWSQFRPFGTGFHGKNPLDGDSSVIELEPGYVDHEKGGTRVTTHDGYFAEDSTAMMNIRGVIKGEAVLTRQVGYDEVTMDRRKIRTRYEPLARHPERYAGNENKTYWTSIESLEK